ncbi:LPXTG cell wall anchor domain-containing protein [Streptacidiphilus sp. EB103A]|uniref:LPXTG cell wall anchor domain-containing protein n=1 Tax=Streptacidiphilus sp. EB103A TaxID=3156275 RepID=UPI003511EBFB
MSDALLRRFARIGAAVVAASAISIGLTVLPAQADSGSRSASGSSALISVIAPSAVTLVPQPASGGPTALTTLTPVVLNEGDIAQANDVVLSIDASGLTGVAELTLPAKEDCAYTDAAHTKAECRLGSVETVGTVDLGVRTLAGAAVGSTAKLSFKATASNAVEDPSDTAADLTTVITVGDGPDLATGEVGSLTVKPGGSASYTPKLRNVGDRDSAKGVVMLIDAADDLGGSAFTIGGNYSNCQYGVGDSSLPAAERTGVLCHFDDVVVHPGDVLQPSAPITVKATSDATIGYTAYGFDTVGGELTQGLSKGHSGTGAALSLVSVPAGSSRALVGDLNYGNNVGIAKLSTGQTLDVMATTGNISGTVGTGIELGAGVANVGTLPTKSLDGAPSAEDTAAVLVALPVGVKVTKVPAGCFDDEPASAQSARSRLGSRLSSRMATAVGTLPTDIGALYACIVDSVIQPGSTNLFTFTVEPTKVLHAAQGAVVAFTGSGIDDDLTNNVADFTVDAVKATTAPVTATASATASAAATASASSPASAAASASATSTGGALAQTGGGDDTTPMLFYGIGAIALGVAGVLLARRRKAGSHG